MNQVIFISGTPCVGKTTLASELSKRLGANLVRINELAIGKDLILGIDNKKGYKIIDVPKLDVALGEIIDNLRRRPSCGGTRVPFRCPLRTVKRQR
mgnify:CR=1 FL=1